MLRGLRQGASHALRISECGGDFRDHLYFME